MKKNQRRINDNTKEKIVTGKLIFVKSLNEIGYPLLSEILETMMFAGPLIRVPLDPRQTANERAHHMGFTA